MIYIICTIICAIAIYICSRPRVIEETGGVGIIGIVLIFIFVIAPTTGMVINDINKVNTLKSQNINMIPQPELEKVYNIKMQELEKVQRLIQIAVDKNKFQIETETFNGLKLYTMPFSTASLQGIGDVERGGAEKLKLLEALIDKQKGIANEVIAASQALIRPEFYERNTEILAMENSLYDGLLVKWFTIDNNSKINIVYNRDIRPIKNN